MKRKNASVNLLECTLRDGSYAVGFRFTKEDTAMLCRLLSGLGFKYIEIGHGLGISASSAGKGKMPSSDRELLAVAKANAAGAKIGMFCIPGIATLSALREMAQQGLDFVRIGANSDQIEEAFPYLEEACKQRLYPMLNFMKSYAITPREFAKKAKSAAKLGAAVIYLVDSAGGMLPEEIAEYLKEARQATRAQLGLHAHNNLQLATANALQAIESGATFIDTTLCGLGRSAGNVPTEVMVALLDNLGIKSGIDLFRLMDAADKYLSPLMDRIQMHDMLSVVMGASKFHSSFFPQVKKAAQKYGVDERRLTFLMGKQNSSCLDEQELDKAAKKISVSQKAAPDYDLTSFRATKIGRAYISNTLKSVANLMDGLADASAKGHRGIVLEVAPAKENDDELVLAEYVIRDQEMVMGRVRFGSLRVLKDILALAKEQIALLLIDAADQPSWVGPGDIYALCRKELDAGKITFYDSEQLKAGFLQENLLVMKNKLNADSLLLCAETKHLGRLAKSLSPFFGHIFVHCLDKKRPADLPLPDNCALLELPADWKNLNLNVRLALSVGMLPEDKLQSLSRGMSSDSYILIAGAAAESKPEKEIGPRLVLLDYALAYRGQFSRWLFAARGMSDG
jgi:4-hydroxy-2-oxovalerate aldolase